MATAVLARLDNRVARRRSLAVAAILLVGLLVRLPLVNADMHTSSDLESFVRWATTAHERGVTQIYDGTDVNYGPLSVYLFATAAFVETHLPESLQGEGALIALIKLPSILADVLTAGLLAWTLGRGSRAPSVALAACALYLFNPAIWYVSVYWGQTDSIYTLFLVAAIIALERGAVVPAWLAYTAAISLKLLAVSAAPLLVAGTVARHGWRGLASGLTAAIAAAALIFSPWLVTGRIGQVLRSAYVGLPAEPPRVDVSAYNAWYLLFQGRVHNASSVAHVAFLPVTYQALGGLMFGVFAVGVVALTLRRGNGVILAAATLSLGMFMLLTQMRERYLVPVVALLLLVAAQQTARRTRGARGHLGTWWDYGLISLSLLFNVVTIGSFAPSLFTNVVAAEPESARILVLKGISLVVAAANLVVLARLTAKIAGIQKFGAIEHTGEWRLRRR